MTHIAQLDALARTKSGKKQEMTERDGQHPIKTPHGDIYIYTVFIYIITRNNIAPVPSRGAFVSSALKAHPTRPTHLYIQIIKRVGRRTCALYIMRVMVSDLSKKAGIEVGRRAQSEVSDE